MKLLFIAAAFPYPLNTGARNHIYHWLQAACPPHDACLLVVGEKPDVPATIPGLPALGVEILSVPVRRTLLARVGRLAASVAKGIPATSLACMPRAARKRAMELAETGAYDAIILCDNTVAGYAPSLAAWVPAILVKHSIQAIDARDQRRRAGMWHPRWLLEEWIAKRFEARTCGAATVVCCVNLEDADELRQRYQPMVPVEVVPVGVDPRRFPPRHRDPGGGVIGFFGNIGWGANRDAALWFAEKVMPELWRKWPSAEFRIIGPGSELLPLPHGEQRLKATGAVADIAAAMSEVTVGVVPVISGTGTRFKLLEMLSMGIPVVTTSLGLAGTECRAGRDVLVADGAGAFAGAVATLLGDPSLRERLSQAGVEMARSFAWEGIYPKILAVLERAAHAPASAVTEPRKESATMRKISSAGRQARREAP
jgi:glycosyltransferase involved in cell wall biosynthesis